MIPLDDPGEDACFDHVYESRDPWGGLSLRY